MSLLDRLTQERKLAYKAKNTPIKEVISFLLSQIQNKEIELQRSLEDSDILQLLKKEIKTRKESVAFLQDAGKMEEADDELSKVDFLAQFVPAPYSKEELRALVEKAMHTLWVSSTPSAKGALMWHMMQHYRDRIDPPLLHEILADLLQ